MELAKKDIQEANIIWKSHNKNTEKIKGNEERKLTWAETMKREENAREKPKKIEMKT